MFGVAPLVGTNVKVLPCGIQIQPYWFVKTHCPAGVVCWTTTSSPVFTSTSVGGGGIHVGAGSVGWTPSGVVSARAPPGERSSAEDSAMAERKVFMASPCKPDVADPAFLHSTPNLGGGPPSRSQTQYPGIANDSRGRPSPAGSR